MKYYLIIVGINLILIYGYITCAPAIEEKPLENRYIFYYSDPVIIPPAKIEFRREGNNISYVVEKDGSLHFRYDYVNQVDGKNIAEGSYGFTGPNQFNSDVQYVADERGFIAKVKYFIKAVPIALVASVYQQPEPIEPGVLKSFLG